MARPKKKIFRLHQCFLWEALGLFHAIEWVSDVQFDNFELDSKITTDTFSRTSMDIFEFGRVLFECRRIFSSQFTNSKVEFCRRQANGVAHALASVAKLYDLAMEVTSAGSSTTYNRLQELKAYDESKAGVKGLVDSGITKIPKMFIMPPEERDQIFEAQTPTQFMIPVIDLNDIVEKRADVVDVIREAVGTVGFFQVVNHGIPVKLLEDMMAGVREFHELPQKMKAEYFSWDRMKKVKYRTDFDLYQSKYANWRDSLSATMAPETLDPQELPPVCRDVTMEYSRQIKVFSSLVFELLSEALGLKSDYLEGIDCGKGHQFFSHYYPPCPEPQLTMGTPRHSDPDFLTILLQDHIGGLQVLSPNGWIDVPPVHGALLVNIGDLLQIISNDKFKSVEHRVLANHNNVARVSVACFFTPDLYPTTRIYGPIKELISDDSPAIYRETSIKEFTLYYESKGLDGNSALPHFRLNND